MKKIAIMGATGYIGKSLIFELSVKKEFEVFLFARSIKKLDTFLKIIKKKDNFKIKHFEKFNNYKYNCIINCIGIGNPKDVKGAGFKLFEITEKFDNLIIDYIKKYPNTIYINLSSGAVYGKNIKEPVNKKTYSSININNLDSGDNYSIAKINSEAKHRSLKSLNIVDLRIFSFFSRFIKLDAGYLISDIVSSIKNKKTLITNSENIIRDYIHPENLLNLIKLIIRKNKINDFFDVYSLKPISKFEMLEYFKKNYGLKYQFANNLKISSPTSSKSKYYSNNKKAKNLGYKPNFSSLNGIEYEIKNIVKK